jgi:DNA-binding transcriptional MerR regulator
MTPGADILIAAFDEDRVEALTGVSKRQLRYWDRTGFFTPAYADEDRRSAFSRIYSFKDVASLRVLNMLRNQNNVPLQHLRKVAQRLRHLADDLWTGTTLWVFGRKVVFQEPGETAPREVVSGQYLLGLPLHRVVEDTERDVKALLARPKSDIGEVSRSRHVNHNAWVVAGTRIPTRAIRRFADAGYSVGQILQEYPDLTPEDVAGALAHEEAAAQAA